MGPVRYDIGDQDVVAFSRNILQLFEQALPDPADRTLFDRLMNEARGQGLSWAESLEYTIRQRRLQCQG